jgi:hypothetical protein
MPHWSGPFSILGFLTKSVSVWVSLSSVLEGYHPLPLEGQNEGHLFLLPATAGVPCNQYGDVQSLQDR